MTESAVERLYRENKELVVLLTNANELSHVNSVEASFRKTFLLAAASDFETRVRDCLINFVNEKANGYPAVVAFLKNKAIERQYHTYFNWKDRNANSFWGFFGSDFKAHMVTVVKADAALKGAIDAFLELGDLRNNLVHLDFASFVLDKTSEEIYELYKKAMPFVNRLPDLLRVVPAPAA